MLEVSGLGKSFDGAPGERTKVVSDVSFVVPEGQCYALLGPSGCGKTTTLRCVAGLEHADEGTIRIGGMVVSDVQAGVFVPVHERPIGMVFQSYAIWPHMNVFDNVSYPLTVQKPRAGKPEIRERTLEALTLVGMQDLADRPATRLSGGQQQRVALARAIARRPKLLLLDEPLSNLDARLRETMRQELSDMIARIGVTALYVTHDQAEAFALADCMAVMDNGRIVQEGQPRALYARPTTAFAASFLGAANILSGRIEDSRAGGNAVIGLEEGGHKLEVAAQGQPGDAVHIVIRPEDVELSGTKPQAGGNALAGSVARVAFLGSTVEYQIDIGARQFLRVVGRAIPGLEANAPVWALIDARRATVLMR
jgi:iron(III) transport system ATP-binding protein